LQTRATLDLMPSMHWPEPVLTTTVERDAGPVLVIVEYRIDPSNYEPFLSALNEIARERRRDGAYDWGVFEDAANPGRFLETFLVESWLEHLRQHERVTNADQILQNTINRLLRTEPIVTHLINAEARRTSHSVSGTAVTPKR
jgi:Transmembrane secretion effector